MAFWTMLFAAAFWLDSKTPIELSKLFDARLKFGWAWDEAKLLANEAAFPDLATVIANAPDAADFKFKYAIVEAFCNNEFEPLFWLIIKDPIESLPLSSIFDDVGVSKLYEELFRDTP